MMEEEEIASILSDANGQDRGVVDANSQQRILRAVESLCQGPSEWMDSYRWEVIHLLLLMRREDQLSVRFDLIRPCIMSNVRESVMCIMEVWNDWMNLDRSAQETKLVFSLFHDMMIHSFQSLPQSQAIHVFTSLYGALHHAVVASRRDEKDSTSNAMHSDSMAVDIQTHEKIPHLSVFESPEELFDRFPELLLLRNCVASAYAHSASSPSLLKVTNAAAFHWMDLFVGSVWYSEGVSLASLSISASECDTMLHCCAPLIETFFKKSETQLLDLLEMDLDTVGASVPTSYSGMPLDDSAWSSPWNPSGVALACLMTYQLAGSGVDHVRVYRVGILAPFYVGFHSLMKLLPLFSTSPKWALFFLRRAIQLMSNSELRLAFRWIGDAKSELSHPATIVARLWEHVVDLGVKTPEPSARTELMNLYVRPLLLLSDAPGALVIMEHLLRRCPYSNVSSAILGIMKDELMKEYDQLLKGGDACVAVFTSATFFVTFLPRLVENWNFHQHHDMIMAALNLLRFAVIRDSQRKLLPLWQAPHRDFLLRRFLEPMKFKLSHLATSEIAQSESVEETMKQMKALHQNGLANASPEQLQLSQQRSIAQQQLVISVCQRVIDLLDVQS
jgi:hypothetical protein